MITPRLVLVPCTNVLARSALGDCAAIGSVTGARPAPGWPSPEAGAYFAAFAALYDGDHGALGWGPWLILVEDVVVGEAGFKGRPRRGVVELGYGVAPGWRGRGIAGEAARALVRWAFTSPSVAAVVAECDRGNEASMRLLQRLGMQHAESSACALLRWELWKAR